MEKCCGHSNLMSAFQPLNFATIILTDDRWKSAGIAGTNKKDQGREIADLALSMAFDDEQTIWRDNGFCWFRTILITARSYTCDAWMGVHNREFLYNELHLAHTFEILCFEIKFERQ